MASDSGMLMIEDAPLLTVDGLAISSDSEDMLSSAGRCSLSAGSPSVEVSG